MHVTLRLEAFQEMQKLGGEHLYELLIFSLGRGGIIEP